jgi:hypothetical protein
VIALDPFSQAISGVLMEINLTGLFVAAGIAVLRDVRSNNIPIKSLILKVLRNLIGMLFGGESLTAALVSSLD